MYEDTAGRALALARVVDAMEGKSDRAFSDGNIPLKVAGNNNKVVPAVEPFQLTGEHEDSNDVMQAKSQRNRAIHAAAMGLGRYAAIGRSAASTIDVTDTTLNGGTAGLRDKSHSTNTEIDRAASGGLALRARRWADVEEEMAVKPTWSQACGDWIIRFLQADPELEDHEGDPESVGGPFQSAVARTINTRVFLKRRILGNSVYGQVQADRLRLAELDFLKRSDWYSFAEARLNLQPPPRPEYCGMLQYGSGEGTSCDAGEIRDTDSPALNELEVGLPRLVEEKRSVAGGDNSVRILARAESGEGSGSDTKLASDSIAHKRGFKIPAVATSGMTPATTTSGKLHSPTEAQVKEVDLPKSRASMNDVKEVRRAVDSKNDSGGQGMTYVGSSTSRFGLGNGLASEMEVEEMS